MEKNVSFSGDIKKRFGDFTCDSRKYTSRLAVALCAGASLIFTVLFFTPCEMFIANSNDYPLSFSKFFVIFLALCVAGTAAFAAVLALFKGKLFNLLSTFVLTFSFAFYIQGTYLNKMVDLGTLNGQSIPWHSYTADAIINTVLWAALLVFPFIITAIFNASRDKIVKYTSLLIVVLQVVGLSSIAIPFFNSPQSKYSGRILTYDHLFDVSSTENVFVFVLDTVDTDDVTALLGDSPDFLNPMGGFTRFTNTMSTFNLTHESLLQFLTQYESDSEKYSLKENANAAWKNPKFLQALKADGFSIDIYTKPKIVFSSETTKTAASLVRNSALTEDTAKYNYPLLVWDAALMSAYRHLPFSMKAPFLFYSEYLEMITSNTSDASISSTSVFTTDVPKNYYFINKTDKLTVSGDSKAFKLIHINGSHPPYSFDENCTFIGSGAATQQQTVIGSFNYVFKYLDKLKAEGLYDSSAIIVTADHGNTVYGQQCNPVLFIKQPGVSSSLPMTTSNAPTWDKDYPATIAHMLGWEDYKDYGTSIFDLKEDEQRVRHGFWSANEGEELFVSYYEVTGQADDDANWKLVNKAQAIKSVRSWGWDD